jgi:hypothetical protein
MRNRYLAAAGTSLAVFILYLLTLSPSVAMWDAGEYLAAVKSLGIPHQPGNPMFVLVGHVAGLLPIGSNYAIRINVLAAFASAVAAGFWFLCAERVLRDRIERTWERFASAAVASLLGATAFTVWNQSVVMEKVYPLALIGLAVVSWLVLQWYDSTDERHQDKVLVLIAYLTGLTYAVHPAGLLTAPATATAVLAHRPRTLLRWKLLSVLVGAFIFGTSPFAFLPIRAAHQPAVNVSAVSACENGTIELGCTFSAETARRLKGVIEREQYGGNTVMVRRAPFTAQLEQYWMYFSWQWLRDAGNVLRPMQNAIAAVMLALGLLGLAALWDRRTTVANGKAATVRVARAPNFFWYFGPLTFTFTLLLITYLNFRYSYGQSPELGNLVEREPRERDYFFMWTFSLWGLLAGLGLASFRRIRLPLLAFALVPLLGNWNAATRSGQTFTRHWGADMLAAVEPNAVVITHGDNDSFPLWYAQAVEGLRPDVTIALTPYLGMQWYARQLNRRSPLWKRTDQELDTIPGYAEFREPQRFVHGAIDAVIEPGFLTRDQLLVLLAIKDTFPNRPIYFSFGNYPHQLGLGAYVKRVGLLQKLEAQPVRETPDTVRLPSGYIDVTQTLALWEKFGGPDAIRREGRWLDKPSDLIPLYYAMVAQDLAQALEARGDTVRANAMFEQTKAIVEAVR